MRWAAWVNEYLVFGRGRAVYTVTADDLLIRRIIEQARGYTTRSRLRKQTEGDDTLQPLVSALAMRDHFPGDAQSFPLARNLIDLFGSGDAILNALHTYNGIRASTFAFDDSGEAQSTDDIRLAIRDGYRQGTLLNPSHDREAAFREDVRNELPGALVFLLGKARPVLRTWEREERLEREYMEGRAA